MQNKNPFRYYFQRQNAIQESMVNISKTRHTRRRAQASSGSNNESSFSRGNVIKLNKGKKFLLDEERNTEIQRSNRILHEKLARCARKSQPNSLKTSQINSINTMQAEALRSKTRNRSHPKKIKTSPTLPALQPQPDPITRSRHNSISRSRAKGPITLFMGHSKIDGVQFKIKIVIAEGVYYLIAQNQHTKIVLEMPEEEYWALHYQEFQENPCNIFKYLVIEKGQISFRVEERKKKIKPESKMLSQLPKGVEKRKKPQKSDQKFQKLPKI